MILCVQSFVSPWDWPSFFTRGPNGGIELQWGWYIASAGGALEIYSSGWVYVWYFVYWKLTLLLLAVPLWPLFGVRGDDLRAIPQRSPEYQMAAIGPVEHAVQLRVLSYEAPCDRLQARIGWEAAKRLALVWVIGNLLLFIASFNLLDDELHGMALVCEAIALNALILIFAVRCFSRIARSAGTAELAALVLAALLPVATLGGLLWLISM